MYYQDNQYVSVRFLKENELILNESKFFKAVPQRYKLKVVDSKLFNQIQTVKKSLEMVTGDLMRLPGWVVSSDDPTLENVLNFKEPNKEFDYLDYISVDFYKSMKWVSYSKRTKS